MQYILMKSNVFMLTFENLFLFIPYLEFHCYIVLCFQQATLGLFSPHSSSKSLTYKIKYVQMFGLQNRYIIDFTVFSTRWTET